MSLERMDSEGTRPALGSIPEMPDVSGILARTNRTLDKVRVIHGANERYFDNLSGKTVGGIRKSLRDAFSIPGDATALIDGKEVNDDFILQAGHNLEFVKQAGVKGHESKQANPSVNVFSAGCVGGVHRSHWIY